MILRPNFLVAMALLTGLALAPAYADEVPDDVVTVPVDEAPTPVPVPVEEPAPEPVSEPVPEPEPEPVMETPGRQPVLPWSTFFVSGMGSYTLADEDRGSKDGYGGLISIGRKINDGLAVELYGIYTTMDPETGSGDALELIGGGVEALIFPAVNYPNIYGVLGAAYGDVKNQPGPMTEYDTAVVDTGVGFLYPITQRILLRGDARLRMDAHFEKQIGVTPGDDRAFTETVFNLGLLIALGEIREAPPKAGAGLVGTASDDDDNDGIPNAADLCPGSPAGAVVNEQGCETDTDGDGVPDRIDQCPDTPRGTAVNEVGCPLDADGDGVPSPMDECPNSPAGAKVLANGCALKEDCRSPRPGEAVDENGCAVEQTFVLRGVKFEFDSDRLTPEAREILIEVVSTLKAYDQIQIQVQGHTDWIGTEEYNQGLSKRRAHTVKVFLASRGIPEGHMQTQGFGETQPIDTNDTVEGRENNRRVELKVIE